MANRPWWATVLQFVLWVLVMALVMGWLGRSRLRDRTAEHQHQLAHPRSTLIIGLTCSLFFGGLAIAFNVFPGMTTNWQASAVLVGFALLSVPILFDYFLARYELSDDGMTYRKLTSARKQLRWSELRRVKYSPVMKWFRLETESGEVVRISVMLMGLPEFASLLLAHASPEAIEPDTLRILQTTAGGNPPSMWG